MNKTGIYRKVAADMFFIQGIWAAYFLGIMFIIHIVKIVIAGINGSEISSYFVNTFIASNIFMLVIGIISTLSFLPYFVSNGVTRKDYFKGTIIGTIGVALAIPIVSAIVSTLLDFIVKLLNIKISVVTFGGNAEFEKGELIGNIVQSIIFTPFVELSSNWILALFIFVVNIFTYYIAGWFIGSAFKRFGIIGIISIPFAFLLITIEDWLFSISLGLFTAPPTIEIPFFLSLLGVVVSLGIICWLIRLLTKKTVVNV